MAMCKSFEEAKSGVACVYIPSDDKVDNIAVTKTSVESPSSYASKISHTSSTKANFWFIEETLHKDADYNVGLPIDSVQEVNERIKNSLYGYFIGKIHL